MGKIVAQLLAERCLNCRSFVRYLLRSSANGLGAGGFYRVFERTAWCWERESVTVPRNGADEPEAVGTGVAGAADAGDSGALHLHGAVRDLSSPARDGENYDAAVLAAGHCESRLAATPTATAGVQARIPTVLAPHMAFSVVPMVARSFIDINVNALATVRT